MLPALIARLTVPFLLLLGLGSWSPSAEEPTLARLAFRVPPQRMGEFGTAYREQVLPILAQHGLLPSSREGRATVDSVFSRLFEMRSLSDIADMERQLGSDPAWQTLLQGLAASYAAEGPDGAIRYRLRLYTTPSGPGTSVVAGSGIRQGLWHTYGVPDGLAGEAISLLQDVNGSIWIGTYGDGVSRYDGQTITTFTIDDGLPGNIVLSMLRDADGSLWFGTFDGVSRYDGQTFTTFTAEDGLGGDVVQSMLQDAEGRLWLGTDGGVSRYDGQTFMTFTTEDGLAHNSVNCITEDSEGYLWFGTMDGASRYDGRAFRSFRSEDGLAGNAVFCMLRDAEGSLWFGTDDGVSRYDGQTFTTLTTSDGLAHNGVSAMVEDAHGNLWFGTGRGVSCYDGQSFATYTTEHGLAHNQVTCIMEDSSGELWFGTTGGVSRHDGHVFQSLLRRDGLGSNRIWDLLQDREGNIWVASTAGAQCYHPSRTSPPVCITNVIADRAYGAIEQVAIPSTQRRVTFAFTGISHRTRPNQMIYLYRLEGYDAGWQQTRESRVAYASLRPGEYTFRVKAVDRDLNYSEEPAEVRIAVRPSYGQIALQSGLALSLLALVLVSGYGLRRRRDQRRAERALIREMEAELQDARRMQMSLMPTASPDTTGIDIAGSCVSANHVGGDFYQYFPQDDGITISLADVTGHAMEAAIPAVMFSGILDKQMEFPGDLEERFGSLNRSLCRSLGDHTYVCLSMLDLDPSSGSMRVANCGCPYPLHYRLATGQIEEIQVEAYPLGIRPDTEYAAKEVSLEPGHYVVLHSDGFSEATNAEEQLFGFDRTMEVIRQGCSEGLSPEDLIGRLIGEVKAFTGDEPQADDMTCVAIKVEA